MPYNVITNQMMACDFWVIQQLEKVNEREMTNEFIEEIRDKLEAINGQLNAFLATKKKN
jgi:hypothetical protein